MTRALASQQWLVRYDVRTRGGHAYVQFRGARDIGIALVQRFGPLGLPAAAHAVALDAVNRRGVTIERVCPVGR
jgi:hypothetical protein